MLPELSTVLEASDIPIQREVLKVLKNRMRWQTNRFIERYCQTNFRCQICGNDTNIQYHHPDYTHPYMINALCRDCHDNVHRGNCEAPPVIDLKAIAVKPIAHSGCFAPLKIGFSKNDISMMAELRKNAGLTIEEVGKKINRSACTISNWENGKSSPRGDMLPKLASLYGCSVEELLLTSERR